MDANLDTWWRLAAAAGVAGLALRSEYRSQRAAAAGRAQIFQDCSALLASPQWEYHGQAYPTLRGVYGGLPVKLEAVPDSLGLRKLPTFWLKLDVLQPLPVPGTLAYLLRPLNHEFWSPCAALPQALEVPTTWPQYASLRTNTPAMQPLLAVLANWRDAFEDERFKELVITPRGVRVVYLAAQGSRLHYGVFRRAQFTELPVPPTRLAQPLAVACAVHAAAEKIAWT